MQATGLADKITLKSIVATAVLGGTVEVIGGGKFANGAISGVYIMMLNHMGKKPGDDPNKDFYNEGESNAVAKTADGIYYINDQGEYVWYADIDRGGTFSSVTVSKMSPDEAITYFNSKMNEYSSLSTDLAITSIVSGLGTGAGGLLPGAGVVAFLYGSILTLETSFASINTSNVSNNYGNYQNLVPSRGIISVNRVTYVPFPLGAGSMIQYRMQYYAIGGGLIGSWTKTIRN